MPDTDSLVRAVFGPKFEEIKKMAAIDTWLDEKYQEGIDQGARQVVLRLLTDKFGRVPENVTQRVEGANSEWCQRVSISISRASSLEELDLS